MSENYYYKRGKRRQLRLAVYSAVFVLAVFSFIAVVWLIIDIAAKTNP